MEGRNADYYDVHAPTVNLEHITSSDDNLIILQKIRDNDPELTCLWIGQDIEDDESDEFVVRDGDDLGWLGYFLRVSTTLTELHIRYLPQENWRTLAFISELISNRSIQKLVISTDLGRDGFHSLGALLKSDTLVTLEFSYGHNFDTIELQCARNIALMLGQQNQRNHLKSLVFEDIEISGEAMAEIVTALSAHPQLEMLDYYFDEEEEGLLALVAGMRNRNLTRLTIRVDSITANGCRRLSTLFQSDHFYFRLSLAFGSIGYDGLRALAPGLASLQSLEELDLSCNSIGNEGAGALAAGLTDLRSLKKLDLSCNSIGDNGLRALAPALASLQSLEELNLAQNLIGDDGLQALVENISHCSKLSKLNISHNSSITSLGVISLPTLLRSDGCSLTEISLYGIRIGNDGAAALADGLNDNNTLTTLHFNPDSPRLTSVGWSAFSKLLCDTSSVNNTHLSNHTLKTIGNWSNSDTPDDVKQLLELNKHADDHVAIHKILKSHPAFDVEPFFEWNLKALPLLVSWFERVITLMNVDEHKGISDESLEAIQSRKLSTMYKFIRGLPHMTTGDDYLRYKNPTKFAFLKRKISNRCFSHLLNGMALRLRVKNADTNRNA